jgi:hypothetical protein
MKTEKSGINNAQHRTARSRRARTPACVFGKDAGGEIESFFIVSNKIESHSKNAVAFWFLAVFAIEFAAVALQAVIR